MDAEYKSHILKWLNETNDVRVLKIVYTVIKNLLGKID
ncbi:MAG: hypothetical protein K0R34_2473 [Herbinix sp.]|jgi:hypothetical protein|nr:hypothetical protein [Herbinix sp.]